MFKPLLSAAAFAVALGAAQTAPSGTALADAAWHGQPPLQTQTAPAAWNGWSDRDRGDRHAHRGVRDRTVLERTYNARLRNESLGLLRGSGLKRDYRGYRIDAVVVTLRPHKSRGRLGLIVNGYKVDAARIGDKRRIRLEPGRADVLGRELRSLRLDVRGRAFVKDVTIKLSRRVHSRAKGRPGFVYENVGADAARVIARAILAQIESDHSHGGHGGRR
jgi:hypothetical protein